MTTPAPHGLVIYACNKAQVTAFYQRTLGLQLRASHDSHDLLEGPGLSLVIHAMPAAIAQEISITAPPALREDTAIKPMFMVADLAIVRREAEATGGGLQPDSRAWQMNGHTVLDGWDPEGNIVQFQQVFPS